LVGRVLIYVPGQCTTVIVVNWTEIGRSMKDRKFRVQSSLFRSLCPKYLRPVNDHTKPLLLLKPTVLVVAKKTIRFIAEISTDAKK
jgi:hypothetical protein